MNSPGYGFDTRGSGRTRRSGGAAVLARLAPEPASALESTHCSGGTLGDAATAPPPPATSSVATAPEGAATSPVVGLSTAPGRGVCSPAATVSAGACRDGGGGGRGADGGREGGGGGGGSLADGAGLTGGGGRAVAAAAARRCCDGFGGSVGRLKGRVAPRLWPLNRGGGRPVGTGGGGGLARGGARCSPVVLTHASHDTDIEAPASAEGSNSGPGADGVASSAATDTVPTTRPPDSKLSSTATAHPLVGWAAVAAPAEVAARRLSANWLRSSTALPIGTSPDLIARSKLVCSTP